MNHQNVYISIVSRAKTDKQAESNEDDSVFHVLRRNLRRLHRF